MPTRDSWFDQAACKPPADITAARHNALVRSFYPIGALEFNAQSWMRYCGQCPVRKQCLRWGIEEESSGSWGGHDERVIAVLRKEIANGKHASVDAAVEYAEARLVARLPTVPGQRGKKRRLKHLSDARAARSGLFPGQSQANDEVIGSGSSVVAPSRSTDTTVIASENTTETGSAGKA